MPVTLGDKSDTSQFVFRKGESFTAVVYSNTAGTIRGNVRVVYDDGTEDDFKFNETSSGSSRAGVILTCAPHVTARPGIVVSMFLGVSGAITQRGMCYAQVWMTNDPQSSGAISLLAQGYIYIGSPLMLGMYVEPGPAGGHGHLRTINIGTPAAGADFSDVSIPSGAMWKIRGFGATLTTSATVANREVTLRSFDGTQVVGGTVATEIQTATLVEEYLGSVGNLSSGTSASLAGGAIGIGLPDLLFNTSFLRVKTNNIQAGDQWSQGFISVEEWTVPN